MSEFLPGVGPVYSHKSEVIHQPVSEPAVPAKPLPPLSPEQIRAVDQAIAWDEENATVAALMGLWTGSMLLGDLAREHLNPPADEERDEGKKDPPAPPE
jgi:hypothetical protein